jgi:hypothetical protein
MPSPRYKRRRRTQSPFMLKVQDAILAGDKGACNDRNSMKLDDYHMVTIPLFV